VYAEMSAVNPIVLLEGALKTTPEKIAKDLAGSITLGVGQFCTNPGLVLMIESDGSEKFLQALARETTATAPATMLNSNICKAYQEGVRSRQDEKEVAVLATPTKEADREKYEAQPVVHTVSAAAFLENKDLSAEIFGPASLVVLCKSETELLTVLQSMEGQLTATVHATDTDEIILRQVVDIISQKAGRIIYGGYPTGVEVCHSMQHGGPFPSTTDSRSTSVGTAAIYRFVRPVAYQGFPDHLLPDVLKNENPLQVLRLVNGQWTKEQIMLN